MAAFRVRARRTNDEDDEDGSKRTKCARCRGGGGGVGDGDEDAIGGWSVLRSLAHSGVFLVRVAGAGGRSTNGGERSGRVKARRGGGSSAME